MGCGIGSAADGIGDGRPRTEGNDDSLSPGAAGALAAADAAEVLEVEMDETEAEEEAAEEEEPG